MAKKTKKSGPTDWREELIDKVTEGDIVSTFLRIPPKSVKLVALDSPYNLGVGYEMHDDKMKPGQFLNWCGTWLDQAVAILDPAGSLWAFISDEYVSEFDVLAKGRFQLARGVQHNNDADLVSRMGGRGSVAGRGADQKPQFLIKRHHISWYFTFGVNSPRKLTRSKTHLLHYVLSDKHDWYPGDPAVRIPSARQAEYNDKRANPAGRLPDDTWILRPKELPWQPDHDVWHVPRVAGTFRENQGGPNQIPERIMERIIRLCTRPGDLVADGFCGSGTTAAVAKKLGRHFITCDTSPTAVARARRRLEATSEGDPIGQAPEGRKPSSRRGGKKSED